METFYHALIEEKLFQSTSLPSLGETEEPVALCPRAGDFEKTSVRSTFSVDLTLVLLFVSNL